MGLLGHLGQPGADHRWSELPFAIELPMTCHSSGALLTAATATPL